MRPAENMLAEVLVQLTAERAQLAAVTAERDALAGQVAAFKERLNELVRWVVGEPVLKMPPQWHQANDALNNPPKAAADWEARVRAEGRRAGLEEAARVVGPSDEDRERYADGKFLDDDEAYERRDALADQLRGLAGRTEKVS